MSKLVIKKENTITDISTWLKYAEPEGGESQWKEGRSAMEFARYMTSSNDLPSEIHNYLSGIGIKEKYYTCYPEHITSFPSSFGRGGGRHHDGLLVGRTSIVGIEAKVSEPFDKVISQWIASGASDASHDNRMMRILSSLSLITGVEYASLDEETNRLRYQLVSSTVGTIIEAGERDGISNAVVLVLEFSGDICDNNNHKRYLAEVARNAEDYDSFIKFLNLTGKTDKERKLVVNWNKKDITVWFKKISISIKKNGYQYNCEV